MRGNGFRHAFAEFVPELESAKAHRDSLVDALRAAGTRDLRRKLIHKTLTSYEAKLISIYEGARLAKQLGRYSPDALRQCAKDMDLFSILDEPVRSRTIIRREKSRQVFSFGPIARARQHLTAKVLGAIHVSRPDQFTLTGGVPGALEATEQAIKAEFHFGAEVDIVSFYPSVRLEGLVSALRPLPRAIVEHVVWTSDSIPVGGSSNDPTGVHAGVPLPSRGLAGLAQGSASSPVAAEIIMAELLSALPQGSRKVAYADNVLIFGRTVDEVSELVQAFADAARYHPAGPLELKMGEVENLRASQVSFLGYDGLYSPRDPAALGTMSWYPAHYKLDRIEKEIESVEPNYQETMNSLRWLRHWQRGYSLWDGGELFVTLKRLQLLAKLAYQPNQILQRVALRTFVGAFVSTAGSIPLEEVLPDATKDNAERRLAVMAAVTQKLGLGAGIANSLPETSDLQPRENG